VAGGKHQKKCGKVAKLLGLSYERAVLLSEALKEAKKALYVFLRPIIDSKNVFDLREVRPARYVAKRTPKSKVNSSV
jgi:hypothetical protein